MAQFYADMQGNRGSASRMGTKDSGMHSHTRGWDVGVRVSMVHVNGKDVAHVYLTSGSNGSKGERYLGCYEATDVDKGGDD
jgi:hypothetical protein